MSYPVISTARSLSGLTDTSINSPISGQYLYFNGSYWVNSSGGSGTSGTSGTGGSGTSGSGSSGTSGTGSPGTSGTSGTGSPGTSGSSGTSGTSGEGSPGTSGSSGTSGNGTSGSSGKDGSGVGPPTFRVVYSGSTTLTSLDQIIVTSGITGSIININMISMATSNQNGYTFTNLGYLPLN